jgi:hypothetical protein
MLDGMMRGGVALLRGVWGPDGDVGEPDESEELVEAERWRE